MGGGGGRGGHAGGQRCLRRRDCRAFWKNVERAVTGRAMCQGSISSQPFCFRFCRCQRTESAHLGQPGQRSDPTGPERRAAPIWAGLGVHPSRQGRSSGGLRSLQVVYMGLGRQCRGEVLGERSHSFTDSVQICPGGTWTRGMEKMSVFNVVNSFIQGLQKHLCSYTVISMSSLVVLYMSP